MSKFTRNKHETGEAEKEEEEEVELLLEGKGWRRCVATPPAEENGERGKDRTTVQSPFLGTLYYKCRIIRGNYGGIFRARHRHQSYDLQQ